MRIRYEEITLKRIVEAVRRRIMDLPHGLGWHYSELARKNRVALENLKDKHHNQRCFVIANGPSLKQMDLSDLKNEITIGMNRVYIAFDDWGFNTNYLVCVNELVLEQFAKEFSTIETMKFFNWNMRTLLDNQSECNFLRIALSIDDHFQNDIRNAIGSGGTVTFACLQLAFYLGFKEVIIIGLDHNFHDSGTPNQTEIRNTKEDFNHFHPDYFPKGMRWQLPDLYRSELAYAIARKHYESNGRNIIDATVGGNCNVFEKGNFSNLVNQN